MTNNARSLRAKLSRNVLKIILIPVLLLGIVLRFTPPTWVDTVFLILLPVIVVLAVIGRVKQPVTTERNKSG
jgi:hypothetical protein